MEYQQSKAAPATSQHTQADSQTAGAEGLELAGPESAAGPLQLAANNSPQVKQLMAMQAAANSSPYVAQLKAQMASVQASPIVQKQKAQAASATSAPASLSGGLPAQLRAGVEQLSGFDMSDVQVHYNSDKPAQLQAEAYAQGSQIHIAPGKEQHLPHEAWHVAQQKAGRVTATGSEGGQAVNTDTGLEAEADSMGAKAMQMKLDPSATAGQQGQGGGVLQHKRLSSGPMQFGKNKKKKRERARREELQKQQNKISPNYDFLKKLGRKYRERIQKVGDLSTPMDRSDQNTYALLKTWKREFEQDLSELDTIRSEAGIDFVQEGLAPAILVNAYRAMEAIKNHLKLPNIFDKLQNARDDEDLTTAMNLLPKLDYMVEGNMDGEHAKEASELTHNLELAFKAGKKIAEPVLRCIPYSGDRAKTLLAKEVSARYKGIKGDYNNQAEEDVLADVLKEFEDFKESPYFTQNVHAYEQLAAKSLRKQVEDAYTKTPINTNVQGFKEAHTAMVMDVNKVNVNPNNQAATFQNLKAKMQNLKAKNLDEAIQEIILKTGERFTAFFEDSPGLLEECLANVSKTEIHQTLLDIKENGKPHSIHNINDYVGDKLNEPLMRWVIEKGIPVEVHATTIMASFAKLKTEGFTDIVQVPSTHTATKKWVAINPVTKKAKVVFQTLPGESYAIQTAGAFLFYEIYDVAPQLKEQVGMNGLQQSVELNNRRTYTKQGYKARNVHKEGDHLTEIILVNEDATAYLLATVPYTNLKPEIGKNGEIILNDLPENGQIGLKELNVKSMDKDKLSMFQQDIDFRSQYKYTLQSFGVEKIDIACIGREGALNAQLEQRQVVPKATIDHPHFKGKVFILDGLQEDDDQVQQDYTLLTLSISPDFFGSRSKDLMEALKDLGVKHISFVGTAGGLAPDSALEQIMAPKKLSNVADGLEDIEEDDAYTNKAQDLLDELHGKDGFDKQGFIKSNLHVGVHSPITESEEMVKAMKDQQVSSVDCEAGFIADALKGSNVSLYAFFFISDVPGTHHSIGQGGVNAGVGAQQGVQQVPQVAKTEQAVLGMIKKAIGKEITNSQKALQGPKYPMNAFGIVSGITDEGNNQVTLKVTHKLPNSGADSRTPGIMKNFHRRLCAILDLNGSVVNATSLQEINDLSDEFMQMYRHHFVVKIA